MRLPYIPNPPPPDHPLSSTPENRALVDSIASRRRAVGHPEGLVELDRALLHSPPVAAGWNAFLGAVRGQTTSVSDEVREVIICRVASLNRAEYEWGHHVVILRRALEEGVVKTMVEGGNENMKLEAARQRRIEWIVRIVRGEVDTADLSNMSDIGSDWVRKIMAVIHYTDAMTKNVEVPQEIWDRFRAVCESDREAVEITSICAAYNCVSRFLVALDVGEAVWADRATT